MIFRYFLANIGGIDGSNGNNINGNIVNIEDIVDNASIAANIRLNTTFTANIANNNTNISIIGAITTAINIDNNAVKIDLTNSTINLINGTGIIGVNIGAIFDANISIIAIIEIIITLVYPVSNLNEKEI